MSKHLSIKIDRPFEEELPGQRAINPGAQKDGLSRRSFLATACASLGLVAGFCSGCTPQDDLSGSMPAQNSGKEGLVTLFDSKRKTQTISLVMTGDVLVHEGIWTSGIGEDGKRSYGHLFEHVAPTLQAADIAIVNQETILGGEELGFSGYPCFNGPQEIADAEVAAGVDVALGATDHALDKGIKGIERELEFWRAQHPEVLVPGIADSQEVANAIPLIERNGIKLAILNYTETTNGIPVPAGSSYCVKYLHSSNIAADVAQAREAGANLVIVCPHWGTEYVYTPTGAQREMAQRMLDAGADAIIGTHPHVLEPLELVEAKDGRKIPIFWSLGNFISRQIEAPKTVGGLAHLTIQKNGDACAITACALEPVVMHKDVRDKHKMAAYRLADYSDELASKNYAPATEDFPAFTVEGCHNFVSMVLGPSYKRDAAQLSYEVNALPE